MKRKFVLPAMILCAVVIAAIMVFGNPLKVTDPADPRFNPDKFCFCDYAAGSGMREAFKKLFPVGTPKEFVDRVLINAGGAEIWKRGEKINFYGYREPRRIYEMKQPPSHFFLFDEDLKLVNISVGGGPIIYKDQPDSKE
jgi:hypothetical protein